MLLLHQAKQQKQLTELHAKSSFFNRCLVSLSGGSLIKWNRRNTLVTRFIGSTPRNTNTHYY